MATVAQQTEPQLGQRVTVPSIDQAVVATVRQTWALSGGRWLVGVQFDRPVRVHGTTEATHTTVSWERCKVVQS